MNLQGDELEYAISQYLDGQLSADLAGVLEERLAVDPAARELLRQYSELRTALATPLPALGGEESLHALRQTVAAHWQTLRENAGNAEVEVDSDQTDARSLRDVTNAGATNYTFSNRNLTLSRENLTGFQRVSSVVGRLGRRRFAVPMALAASLLIAFTTIEVFVAHPRSQAPAIANVVGPHSEAPTGAVVAEVSIGPAPSVAASSRLSREEVGDRPSIVLIDRADNPPPDGDSIY